jgi:SAM-dependent methyltransferase
MSDASLEPGSYDAFPFISDFYDYTVPYVERPDIGFYVQTALEYGGPVLEVGCGSGRILVPIARAGVTITGVDMSKRMLARCRENLAEEPPQVQSRVRLVEGDMRAFDLGETFPVVTLPFRPIQHLNTIEEQVACLETMRRHVAPGGRLVLDVYNPDLGRLVNIDTDREDAEPPFTMPDGRVVVRSYRATAIDLAQQVSTGELLFDITYPNGRQERLVEPLSMRYYFRYEMEHLLARCGFEIEHLYGSFDRQPFGAVYPGELIFVARPVS